MINIEKDVVRILCISDIHGNKKLAEKIFEKETYDFAISPGDTELNDSWVKTYFKYAVSGNNDFHSRLPDELVINLKNFTIYLAHGHTFGSYYTLMDYDSMLKTTSHLNKVDLFINGHTHFPLYYPKQKDNKAFLNPGSITYPRFGSDSSYVILTINIKEKKIIDVLFKKPYE